MDKQMYSRSLRKISKSFCFNVRPLSVGLIRHSDRMRRTTRRWNQGNLTLGLFRKSLTKPRIPPNVRPLSVGLISHSDRMRRTTRQLHPYSAFFGSVTSRQNLRPNEANERESNPAEKIPNKMMTYQKARLFENVDRFFYLYKLSNFLVMSV